MQQSVVRPIQQSHTRTLAAELPSKAGDDVRLEGWVHRRRRLASVTFVVLRDRSGLAQVVVRDPLTVAQVEEIGEETVVEVTGKAVANPQAPGGVEVGDPTFTLLSDPAETPPVELWRPTVNAALPTLLDHAPVALRHPLLRAPFEIAAAAVAGFRSALTDLALHRDADAEDRRCGDRERCERLPDRLLRPTRVPRTVSAVLQADAGRCIRAGLRGRSGLSGRAARHHPAHRGVRLARRASSGSSPTIGT